MRGDLFLLKAGDGAATEVFTTVDLLRATSISMNGETVEVTSKDDLDGSNVLWQTLLDGAGKQSLSISADGVWGTKASSANQTQQLLRTRWKSATIHNYQIDDGEETIECAFKITSFELSGDEGAEQTYSVTLESSGEPTFGTSP